MASQYQAGIASLILAIDRADIITANSNIVRDDQKNLKVWISKTQGFNPSPTNLFWDAEGLLANITNLEVEKAHYFRYALTSALDPSIFTISSEYSFIPKTNLVAATLDPPPIPALPTVTANINSISVTMLATTNSNPKLSQGIDYNFSLYTPTTDPTSLYQRASSSHKSTIIYGKEVDSITISPTAIPFSSVKDKILGEFENDRTFAISAEPGAIYALYFAYKNKGGLIGLPTPTPIIVKTGIDVQKFLDLLAGQITEGQLYKELQKRISRLDRSDDSPITEISNIAGQYTVKIDAGGQVAGFGLSNTASRVKYDPTGTKITGQLEDGQPFSEFGVVADRFWIGAPAEISATKPTTDLWHGKVWVDSTGGGKNAGPVEGVTAYHNSFNPIIFNPITMPNDLRYWYWELVTKTELNRLIAGGAGGYVSMGSWSKTQAYALKNYIFDGSSGCYYICTKAYTPTKLTSISTKNPKITGGFTASGASIGVGDVIYIEGSEKLPDIVSGSKDNPAYKMGPSYNSKGTYYYVISGNTSEFVLSLSKNGKGITTGIGHAVQYYKKSRIKNPQYKVNVDKTDPTYDPRYWIDDPDPKNSDWVGSSERDMLPFITQTTGDNAGVYINAAYIKDATITNAMIQDASIDSAKIIYLNADKIQGGTIEADRINAGAISIKNVDIGSLRGAFNTSWSIVMPTLSTSAVTRTVDLAPGSYQIVLQATFARMDKKMGYNTDTAELAEIEATVTGTGVTGSVKCIAYWRKHVPQLSTANIKIKNKLADITTQPTYTFSGGVTADIPPGPPGPPAPPSGGGGSPSPPPSPPSGGGGGGCLAYGTPILMHDNTIKNMEDLQIGDMIKSITIEDLSTEENAWKDYSTNLFSCIPTIVTVTDIRLDTFHSYYNINNNLLKITYEHPLLVRRGSEYKFVRTIDLVTGDFIYHTTNGWIQVTSKEFINEPIQTVSVDTEFEDVYFANGILVHNFTAKL